jgi:Amt family ammonium transporter
MYALLLVAAVSIVGASAMSTAYAQSVDDGMDGYVVAGFDVGYKTE